MKTKEIGTNAGIIWTLVDKTGSLHVDEIRKKTKLDSESLFMALGFQKILVVEKKRRLWKLHQCEVALDRVSQLGCFVEIEGPDDEAITYVQQILELSHSPSIIKSYAQMIREKRNHCEM